MVDCRSTYVGSNPTPPSGVRRVKLVIIAILLLPAFCPISVGKGETKIWINEVMYNPDDGGTEWIELYNPNSFLVDISGWYISDDPSPYSPGREGACRFPENTFISEKSYLIIAENGSAFYREYGFYPDFEIEDSNENVRNLVIESRGFKLSNSGDDIHLFNDGLEEIDVVWYGDGGDLGRDGSAPGVRRGYSLSRYRYSGIPSNDFRESSIPTPGEENFLHREAKISIDIFPKFLPKIEKGKEYSLIFLIKVSLNTSTEGHWRMKAYVVGKNDSRYPSTQTWNGEDWIYSYRYAFEGYGNFSEWIALRFCRKYEDYENIENGSEAFIYVKCEIENDYLIDFKRVYLLDMDNSTSNASEGGLVIGRINERNRIIMLKSNGTVLSTSISEINHIEDGNPEIEGFFKMYAPLGVRLTLVDERNKVLRDGLFAIRGYFDVNAWMGRYLWVENCGDFPETIIIEGKKRAHVFLYPGEIADINISEIGGNDILVYVEEDPSICKHLRLPRYKEDISIAWIKIEGAEDFNLGPGRVYKIRVRIDNNGDDEIRDIIVKFYLDGKEIGWKLYDRIGRYPKYPSVILDTSGLAGRHKITVVIDYEDKTLEKSININISDKELVRNILITKVFCYGFSWLDGEFLEICNQNNQSIDISGWYFTDRPNERVDKQPKIVFPEGSIIEAGSSIVISSNSSAYKNLFACYPDFEYNFDIPEVKDMIEEGSVILNNKADVIALKDRYNRTIDVIIYGEWKRVIGWEGKPVGRLRKGEIFERKRENGPYLDTNTSLDWKIVKLGRSKIDTTLFSGNMGIVGAVSPDCSLSVLIKELNTTKRFVILNSYLFANPWIEDILMRLMERGVNITILVEGNPVAEKENKDSLKRLKDEGAIIYEMKSSDGYRRYRFDHAKYCIIDNRSLIIGSANFDRNGYPKGKGNREWLVIVRNSSVARFFYRLFKMDISMPDVCVVNISARDEHNEPFAPEDKFLPRMEPLEVEDNVTILPIISPDNSEKVLVEILRRAKQSIYIEQMIFDPYEIDRLTRELINASRRGVDVKIIVNSRYAEKEKLSVLRDYGIDVKLVDPKDLDLTNIHVKGIIVDNSTVVISSINLNHGSIYENREAGLVIENQEIARYFAKAFFLDWRMKVESSEKDYKSVFLLTFLLCLTLTAILKNWRSKIR